MFNFQKPLPLDIDPIHRYDFEGGFCLGEKRGNLTLYLISKSIHYTDYGAIEINGIIRYGYNQDEIIALVDDIVGKRYLIRVFYKTKLPLEEELLDYDTLPDIEKSYKWIYIDGSEEYVDLLAIIENILLLYVVMVLIFGIIQLIKWIKNGLTRAI
jgi:hypothetical protein